MCSRPDPELWVASGPLVQSSHPPIEEFESRSLLDRGADQKEVHLFPAVKAVLVSFGHAFTETECNRQGRPGHPNRSIWTATSARLRHANPTATSQPTRSPSNVISPNRLYRCVCVDSFIASKTSPGPDHLPVRAGHID
ncbi:hypothetical protein CKAH01_16697 [Colletotrichum kahawae]|uniref:Uncharacterized protein n=1 Tax=Colletotrichum kahawae TaxID=34407 RepID=A0AAD9YCU0_COLKA|nr:hypothetical protein CKAH01_16697 [Colletotrichum kahawae]